MRTIMIMNAKGGCGKTTIATNLAGFYASKGKAVTLADFDPQGSSLDWLDARPDNRDEIIGLPAYDDGLKGLPRSTEVLIMDAPAAVHGKDLTPLIRRVQSLVVPVLPSPIDIRAVAHFIEELLLVGKVKRDEVKLAVVANRVREHTLIYDTLERFLRHLDIPRIASLRDTQNYIRAAEKGLSIFEMAPSQMEPDVHQWSSLTRWLNSKRSLPDT
jgi:chromosome partitioning protein